MECICKRKDSATCPCRQSATSPCHQAVEHTSAITAAGLIGGFAVARYTGVRALGGVVLGAAGLAAGNQWLRRRGPATAGALGALYLAAFGASHPLAKKLGAWPSVLAVTAVVATAAHLASDARH